MKKSKKGFIFGLLGTILGTIFSIVGYALIIVTALALSLGKNSKEGACLILFQYCSFASIILAIIALLFCFKFKKFSGILMLLSAILYSTIYIYLLILNITEIDLILIIIQFIPSLLFLLSAINFFKKPKIVKIKEDTEKLS